MHANETIVIKPMKSVLVGGVCWIVFSVGGLAENPTPLAGKVYLPMGLRNGTNCVIGPQVPHGSVNPSPQTPHGGHGGYQPGEPVRGFGQLQVSGTGWGRYGQLLVSPQLGLGVGESDHDSPISDEVATPSYYAVNLDRYGIRTELTPTQHAVIYRFTFPKSTEAHLVLDLAHSIPTDIATEVGGRFWEGGLQLCQDGPNAFSGWGKYSGGFGSDEPYTVYFYAVVDKTPTRQGTWKNGVVASGNLALHSDGRIGCYLGFSTKKGGQIRLKIGVSFKSIELARRYALEEINGFDFEGARKACAALWEGVFGQAVIEGATDTQARIFYTALYHSFVMPHDRTGDNPQWESHSPYWDDQYATWDTWRTKFPLMVLLRDVVVRDNILCYIDRLDHTGSLGDSFVSGRDGPKQGGDDLDEIIAEAYSARVPGINWEQAFKVLKHNAEHQRYPAYLEQGWIPDDGKILMSCSNTLECSYNDSSAAMVAKGLGKQTEYRAWLSRARQWEHLWDKSAASDGFAGFVRPRRSDGSWLDCDPKQVCGSWKPFFYEGSSWTYSYFVPGDFARLIVLCGGRERFVDRLDHSLSANLIGLDNEPSFLVTHAFNYAGRPDRTAFWTSKVMRKLYGLTIGYPGNDDSGAMGSWYVFSAIGFLPNAGQGVFLINGPFCRKITVTLSNGRKLIIEGQGVSEKNIYIQSMTLNGKAWDRNWLTYTDLFQGGRMEFVMGPEPSGWGTHSIPPPSLSDPGCEKRR